jgi:hypothetical protein
MHAQRLVKILLDDKVPFGKNVELAFEEEKFIGLHYLATLIGFLRKWFWIPMTENFGKGKLYFLHHQFRRTNFWHVRKFDWREREMWELQKKMNSW